MSVDGVFAEHRHIFRQEGFHMPVSVYRLNSSIVVVVQDDDT
jgi:hypothetical protein